MKNPDWQPRYPKLEPGKGPSLFDTKEMKVTATALLKILRRQIELSERQRLPDFRTMKTHRRLVDVVKYYLYNREEDNEPTYSDLKITCREMILSLDELIKDVKSIKERGRSVINLAYRETQEKPVPQQDIVALFEEVAPKLRASCIVISEVPTTKVGKRAVNNACWEDLSGRRFRRNFSVYQVKLHRPNYTHDFYGADARLIYSLVRCLDPAVMYSQVQDRAAKCIRQSQAAASNKMRDRRR